MGFPRCNRPSQQPRSGSQDQAAKIRQQSLEALAKTGQIATKGAESQRLPRLPGVMRQDVVVNKG
jgi:hypothetical protein